MKVLKAFVFIQQFFMLFKFCYGIGIAANIRIGQLLGSNKANEALNAAKITYLIAGIKQLLPKI